MMTRRKPCPVADSHLAALTDDRVWANWPLVGISKDQGIETRRCPRCSTTQSRLLADEVPVAA